jgi:hypothetical protein
MTEALPAPGDDDGSVHDVALVERQDSSSVQRINSYKTASKPAIEEPLASGLSNEDLWMLIRRFNKVRPVNSIRSVGHGKLPIITRQT